MGLAGLKISYGLDGSAPAPVFGFGPLVDDPARLLALPEGFSYTVISRAGERMNAACRTSPPATITCSATK